MRFAPCTRLAPGSTRITLRGALAFCSLFATCTAGTSTAQSVDPRVWITNGNVLATALAGNTLYVGGAFSQVGPATGGGVPIDASTGLPPPSFPTVVGSVFTAVSDGSGGWYISGQFTSVGGIARTNLARVRADQSVSGWNPNPVGSISTITRAGGTVYVGGNFSSVGGQTRSCIAALDTTGGAATAWNPGADNSVDAILVSGNVVYAGGAFSNIGGQSRNRIGAVSAVTGLATAWNPNVTYPSQPGSARVVTLAKSGPVVYAGGDFSAIGGQTRNFIAAIDTAGAGNATGWNPNASSTVYTLLVSGANLYAGGGFTTIGGQPRNYIAALDTTAGAATGWNPNADQYVNVIVPSGATVYVGGAFANIGGQTRFNLAELSVASGLPTSWDPHPDNPVNTIVPSGATIYVGGSFRSVGAVARGNIAAIDVTTGAATDWDPNVVGPSVNALMVIGANVYAGGSFTNVGGQIRPNLAAIDVITGGATSWTPSPDFGVWALAASGNTIYAGGSFTNIGGQPRLHIAALDAGTGLATSWNPSANTEVYALLVNGARVFAGGTFATIGGQSRSLIAALDTTGGAATSWNPAAVGSVVNVIVTRDTTILAGGSFSNIGAQPRSNLAALGVTNGLATSWNPNASGSVFAIAVREPFVYAAGGFASIGGQARNRLGAVDATTGTVVPWVADASIGVARALALGPSTVYAGGFFTSVLGLPRRSLAGIAAAPAASAIVPASGGNAGALTATIYGSGLPNGASVALVRSGYPTITGTFVTVAAGGMSLEATFDLTGRAAGAWDVVVTTPDLQTATLPAAFTIEAVDPPGLVVSLIGPPQIRANRRYPYDLVIQNPGNVDAIDVPVWLAGVPLDATLERDFALGYPPQSGGEPAWSGVPLTFTSPGGMYLPLVIPRVPPGTTVRRVFLSVPTTPSFKLRAAVTPPWMDGDVFRGCLVNGGISNPACMGAQLTTINGFLGASPTLEALSGIGVWAKIAWQCEGAANMPAALAKAEQVLDFMDGPVESPVVALAACSNVLPPRWRDSLVVTIVGALDPNEKLGSRDSISVHQAIPYSIRFENSPNATAPAQDVIITDPLNITWLDHTTVSLGDITFGATRIIPPPGLSSFATTVDLRPGRNLLVQVSVGLDPISHALGWSFVSIDPATGYPPTDPLAGFLPPNVTPPQGEGSVFFTVMPKPSLPAGTIIHNSATINFDGATTTTNDWQNHLDNAAPASHVLPLAANSDLATIPVEWTADGSPSDLRDYTICVSEDNAPFRVWRQNVATTADTLRPPGDHRLHSYAFYSQSRDISGNVEAAPGGADATTQSRVAVETAVALELALEGSRPNPVTGEFSVRLTLPAREPATLDLIDVAGRRVLRRDVGTLGPGVHRVSLDATPIAAGLYFLRLAQGGATRSARVAVVR